MVGTTTQRAQSTPPVSSSSSNTAASTVASSGNSGIGQHVLGAAPVTLGTVVGSIAPISQPGLAQVSRPALTPSHAIQPSLLSQRLVLTSQAQARLPSKWPSLPSFWASPLQLWHKRIYCSRLRPLFGALLICFQYLFLNKMHAIVQPFLLWKQICSHISSIWASAFSSFFLKTCMYTERPT